VPAPEEGWQPSRKRAEDLFGGSSSLLPVDLDVMGDIEYGSDVKWDGGKAARLSKASASQGDYSSFLPSKLLISGQLQSAHKPTEEAVNQLNWMLARNASVSNRKRRVAMTIAGERLNA